MPLPPPPHQIAGALLEEAILAVLDHSGFKTLENLLDDLTIDPQAPPVTIHGRGAKHQIDAVADPLIAYPFSNPARLLVEAKAYSPRNRVGLDIVRNAVGTLKDLSEFWRPAERFGQRMTRYNYRYAIFASSEFTEPAQAYAYCHDVYLLPLRRSAFFRPIVTAIDNLRTHFLRGPNRWPRVVRLSEYRLAARAAIRGEVQNTFPELAELVAAVRQVQVGLIGVAGRQFPLFLTPRTPAILEDLRPIERVRIFWDEHGWYLRRPHERENLFSFDLPTELFKMYADEGLLDRAEALRLKAEHLVAIQSFIVRDGNPEIIRFELDREWIYTLLERANERRRGGGQA